ncbi:5-azacytidine-induced protein 1-like [Planoprotostelium fungivorum]|uniref:5-azacytidine-induced protein 1-like n=1 Tax=Planoprotostelium fungivorum TaxID=1890364 RepID=A0A2P6NN53_9EUKA|nr:5-azacytidine-induced protein 1-like [Planoprotostelium fungivorum]
MDEKKVRKSSTASPSVSAPTTPRGVKSSTSSVPSLPKTVSDNHGKLNSLMDFLDKVEDSHKRDERALESPRKVILAPLRQNVEAIELAEQAALEAKKKMVAVQVQLDDKTRTVEAMQKTINDLQKSLTEATEKEHQSVRKMSLQEKKKLNEQKKQFDEVAQRQVGFIEQLLKDKEALNSRCEALVKETKTLQIRFEDNARTMEENHADSMKKMKAHLLSGEKTRRETFLAERVKEIKDMTIKGLEPEIEKMVAKHKEEMLRLDQEHKTELKRQRETMVSEFETKWQIMRDKIVRDKHEEVEKERERWRNKLLDQSEGIDKQPYLSSQLLNERKKLLDQMQEEKTKHNQEIIDMKSAHQEDIQTMKDRYDSAVEKEIQSVREELAYRKREDEDALQKRLENENRAQLEAFRKKITKERDQEIDLIIAKFEEEISGQERERQRNFDQQLNIVQQNAKTWEARYLAAISAKGETEVEAKHTQGQLLAQIELLSGKIQQMDQHIHQQEAKHRQREDDLSEALHHQRTMHEQFVHKSEHNEQSLKHQLEEKLKESEHQKTTNKEEVTKLNHQKEEELSQLHERVKKAISSKDEVIGTLRSRLEEAEMRLEQQALLLEKKRVSKTGLR